MKKIVLAVMAMAVSLFVFAGCNNATGLIMSGYTGFDEEAELVSGDFDFTLNNLEDTYTLGTGSNQSDSVVKVKLDIEVSGNAGQLQLELRGAGATFLLYETSAANMAGRITEDIELPIGDFELVLSGQADEVKISGTIVQ